MSDLKNNSQTFIDARKSLFSFLWRIGVLDRKDGTEIDHTTTTTDCATTRIRLILPICYP
ncbi:MAG: hypothetical protein JKY12_05140 [Sneathiella sp.]|nr:hypothetical protein [Sneathiella sp.]